MYTGEGKKMRFFWKFAKLGNFLTPIFFDGILFSAIENHGMWGQIRQNNKEKKEKQINN